MVVTYVVQNRWLDKPWLDHDEFDDLAKAKAMFAERKADPIWSGEGKRKWRLVRRTVVNELVED